jgi:nucleoside-triphosphatase THEP1
VAQKLKEGGVRVGGVVSREIRINHVRTGFEFIDLATNDRDIWLPLLGMAQELENITLTYRDVALLLSG